jgi:hypothetical protein
VMTVSVYDEDGGRRACGFVFANSRFRVRYGRQHSMAIEGLHRVWPTKLQANTALLLYAGSEHRSGLVCNCKTARCDGVASGSVLCLKMEKLVS